MPKILSSSSMINLVCQSHRLFSYMNVAIKIKMLECHFPECRGAGEVAQPHLDLKKLIFRDCDRFF